MDGDALVVTIDGFLRHQGEGSSGLTVWAGADWLLLLQGVEHNWGCKGLALVALVLGNLHNMCQLGAI